MKKYNYKYNFNDKLIFLSLLVSGVGNYNNLLPLNLSQIFILILSFSVIIKSFKSRKFYIPRTFIFSFIYVLFVTFIININGVESIKTLGILSIYIVTFYNYIKQTDDKEKIIKILYDIAFVYSLIGIIQEIGYLLKIQVLYDFSYLGINNAVSISGNMMRITSLLTEPAHFATIIIPGICIVVIDYFKIYRFKFNKRYKNMCFFIASILTFSLVVYTTIGTIFIYNLLFVSKNIKYKMKIIILIITIFFGVSVIVPESLLIINQKIESLFNLNEGLDTNNLSGFAVVSNIRIALENLRQGSIFGSGLDSHIKTYFKYIDQLYSNVVMYLNYTDAGSLYTRILSEFGILGILSYIIFIIKSISISINNKYNHGMLAIRHICIITIITIGLRNGSYINTTLILLICMLLIQNIELISYKNKGNKTIDI